jgi:hypothetical protein
VSTKHCVDMLHMAIGSEGELRRAAPECVQVIAGHLLRPVHNCCVP